MKMTYLLFSRNSYGNLSNSQIQRKVTQKSKPVQDMFIAPETVQDIWYNSTRRFLAQETVQDVGSAPQAVQR